MITGKSNTRLTNAFKQRILKSHTSWHSIGRITLIEKPV